MHLIPHYFFFWFQDMAEAIYVTDYIVNGGDKVSGNVIL